jgi:hypothetical protein
MRAALECAHRGWGQSVIIGSNVCIGHLRQHQPLCSDMAHITHSLAVVLPPPCCAAACSAMAAHTSYSRAAHLICSLAPISALAAAVAALHLLEQRHNTCQDPTFPPPC